MQYAESERRALLGYATAPTLDRTLVARFALGERELADSILEPFRVSRFERVWNDLVKLAQPALAIEVKEGKPGSRSKFGGLPDLPDSADWPRRGQKPLAFIAQLDLAEVRTYLRNPALPTSGLLSFFDEADEWTSGHSPEHEGAWRVLLLNEPVSPQSPPVASPPDVPEDYEPATWGFEAGSVTLIPRISLPETEHVLIDRLGVAAGDDDEYNAYGALIDELRQAHGLNGVTQLLGYPAEIQHDPFISAQLAANGVDTLTLEDWESDRVTQLLASREPWRLLLQVDSISDLGMEWGDSGILYYCIRDEDLRARAFAKAWLVMDSL